MRYLSVHREILPHFFPNIAVTVQWVLSTLTTLGCLLAEIAFD